jgi:hypothetical protein
MAEELLFTVAGSVAMPAQMISLTEAGLSDHRDLEEWVLSNPQILGPAVKVVAFDIDREWGSATASHDRLSILGLASDGRVVVAELKHGRTPDHELGAIKYAAMASRLVPEMLAERFVRFHGARGTQLSAEEALAELHSHAPDMGQETLRKPRIVLLARSFTPTVTASAVWLNEMGVDVSLVQISAFRSYVYGATGGQNFPMISVSQLYPLRDVEEFTISPERQLARELEDSKKRVHDASTVRRLVGSESVADGTIFTFSPRGDLSSDLREQLDDWLHADPVRRTAHWQNRVNAPLVWDADKHSYTPSSLVRHIVEQATGVSRDFFGTQWWRDSSGWTLVELAGPLSGGKGALYREFWSRWLDRIRLEHGHWTQMSTLPAQSWITLPSPITGTHYGLSFSAGGRLRSELYIDAGNQEASLAQFQSLHQQSELVETIYGSELSWEKLPDRFACRIADYSLGEVTKLEDHDSYISWMIASQERLRQAIDGVLGYMEQSQTETWTRR